MINPIDRRSILRLAGLAAAGSMPSLNGTAVAQTPQATSGVRSAPQAPADHVIRIGTRVGGTGTRPHHLDDNL